MKGRFVPPVVIPALIIVSIAVYAAFRALS
jgi:hypothetical protein